MSYLERNAELIAEVGQNLRLKRDEVVGSSGQTTVYVSGSYHSSILGHELFVGIKQCTSPDMQVAIALSFISVVTEKMPELASELPLFCGLVVGRVNKPLVVITEDFSEGNKHRVFGCSPRDILPVELSHVFEGQSIHPFELRHLCFMVNGRRRMGDFNSIMGDLPSKDKFRIFPIVDLYKGLGRFTLKVDYDL